MTHAEARQALKDSSHADCIVARLHAHQHSRGVSWSATGEWNLARYKEIAKNDSYIKRLETLGAIERK